MEMETSCWSRPCEPGQCQAFHLSLHFTASRLISDYIDNQGSEVCLEYCKPPIRQFQTLKLTGPAEMRPAIVAEGPVMGLRNGCLIQAYMQVSLSITGNPQPRVVEFEYVPEFCPLQIEA